MPTLKRNYHLIYILFPIVVIPLLFSFSSVDPALNIRFVFLSVFLVTLSCYLFVKIKKIIISKVLLYYLLITLAFSLFAFIALLYSVNFSNGIFEAFRFLLFSFLVFLFYLFFKEKIITFYNISLCFNALSYITFFIAAYQLWNLVATNSLSHEKLYGIYASFANKNIYSEVLLISIPFVFYNVLKGNKILKIASIVNIILSVFFITILLTRTVWMAAIFGLFATLILKLISSRKSLSTSYFLNKKYLLFGAGIVIVIASSVLIYGSKDKTDAFRKQIKDIGNFNYGSTKDRIELWKRTVSLFKTHPIIGNGSGSWEILILKYGSKDLKSEDNVTFYQRPHNDYLWILAEQGLIGFSLYLASVIFIFILFFRKLKTLDNPHEKEILYLLFFGWFCYLIFSFFSFPSERIEHIIFHAVIIGFLFSISSKVDKQISINSNARMLLFSFVILSCLVSFYVASIRYISEINLQQAFRARSEQNNPLLIKKIKEAENKLYELDSYSTPLAWYSGSAFFLMNNIPSAHADFLRAYCVNPNHIHVLNNLGTTYELLGKHDSSEYFYNKALDISPKFEDALLNICAVKFNLKNIAGAYNNLLSIDSTTTNPKYKTYLTVVLKSIVDSLNNTVKNPPLNKIITSIGNFNPWMLKLHHKSISGNTPFPQQVMMDAEYLLMNGK